MKMEIDDRRAGNGSDKVVRVEYISELCEGAEGDRRDMI